MHATRRWTLLVFVVLVVVSLLAGSPAGANSPRITRGDAQAILQASPNGFWAVQLHSPVLQGAPSDAQARGAIRPYSDNDGQHYCAEDWHVILLGIIIGGDASFTRPEAEAILNTVMLSFALDGVPLSTTRTTVKPFLNPEFLDEEKAYAFQEGRIMAPTDISVGSHQLVATVSEPGFPTEVLEITFFIDAPGTGVCL
jgi:hypothetical protein